MDCKRIQILPQKQKQAMKLRPDNAPMINLSQHRRAQEYEQTTLLRELARFVFLVAFGAALFGGYVWIILNTQIWHP